MDYMPECYGNLLILIVSGVVLVWCWHVAVDTIKSLRGGE